MKASLAYLGLLALIAVMTAILHFARDSKSAMTDEPKLAISTQELLSAALEKAKDPDLRVRVQAYRKIRQSRDSGAQAVLLKFWKKTSLTPLDRVALAGQLLKYPDLDPRVQSEAKTTLFSAAQSKDPDLKRLALQQMQMTDTSRAKRTASIVSF